MSKWLNLNDRVIENEVGVQSVGIGARNYLKCANGDIAAFETIFQDEDGNFVLQIYDASSGDDIPLTVSYAMAGRDLLNGLFSSAIIPTLAIDDVNCRFLKFDY